MADTILEKIEKAGLVGRGGAEYPTAKKWHDVGQAQGKPKYVICNASEGEIGLFKDLYILKQYPEHVMRGMVLGLQFLKAKDAFLNINKCYYRQVGSNIEAIIKPYNDDGYSIRMFIKEPCYIGGEETALLNAIEGRRVEPRLKPPYPSVSGLYEKPTLINNVETFYNVARVEEGTFVDDRFYSILGDVENGGVYQLPADLTIEEILRLTGNYPPVPFFVQVGGSASGSVYNQKQVTTETMTGAGGLEVYEETRDPKAVLLRWLEFYERESCGKCSPCRMGTVQLYRIVKHSRTVPWEDMFPILETMEKTSFCALGRSVSVPILTYYNNVISKS